MSPSLHAILGPSSAKRWINCPPSARINALQPQRDTVYTREGTIAHTLCELNIRQYLMHETIDPDEREAAHDCFLELKAQEPALDDWTLMQAYANVYLDEVQTIYESFPHQPYIVAEQRVSFGDIVPDGFGTADCILIGDGICHVVDFKYGKGVAVSATDNPQMKLYGLGAARAYGLFYDIDEVRMSIIQPRISKDISTWSISMSDLNAWAENIAKPAAQQAFKGEGEFKSGDWCRWCANEGVCRAQARRYASIIDLDAADAETLSNAEIAKVLEKGEGFDRWLEKLKEIALTRSMSGSEIPGYKVVRGRAIRSWKDQTAAFTAATEAGIPDAMLWEKKPVTVAALEKIMGKKAFKEAMDAHIYTPDGKPTLVSAADRREAIRTEDPNNATSSAATDFN